MPPLWSPSDTIFHETVGLNFTVGEEQSNIWSNTFMLGRGQLHPVRKGMAEEFEL